MAPSLRASVSPLESSQRERKSIAKLTLAFIAISVLVHWLIGAAYQPKRIVITAEPRETTLVITRETPTPTPEPSTPTPTPAPARHVDSTPQPGLRAPKILVSPPVTRPGSPNPGESPGPRAPASPGGTGPTDTPPLPPASAAPDFAPCRIVHKVEPVYPDVVKQGGYQGTVAVILSIGPNGEVLSARVGESSGNQALDDSALAAARASTYQCPPAAGREVELYQVIYRFTLDP